jgi:hypothetical protein
MRNSEHSHTYHYVTFEVESGDRLEFSLTGSTDSWLKTILVL